MKLWSNFTRFVECTCMNCVQVKSSRCANCICSCCSPCSVFLPKTCGKKVVNPSTHSMLGMLVFPKFGGRGVPMVVDTSEWVATGRLTASVQTRKVPYLLWFCSSFEVKFCFPHLGKRWPLWVWVCGPSWCQMGHQWLPTDRITNPLGVCYGFAAVFNLFFDYPNFRGRGAPRAGVDNSTAG